MSDDTKDRADTVSSDEVTLSGTEADLAKEDFFDEPDPLVDQVSDHLTQGVAREGEEQESSEEPVEEVLEEERVKDEIEIQIDLLKDTDWVVRREAVITLGEMGDERCVAPVLSALRDGDWQVRDVAIEALGEIGSPAIEGLIRLLRDWDIRRYALMAMGKIKDERVLDPIISHLKSDEFHEYATDAIVEIGEPAIEKLLPCLQSKDELVRKQAVIALGRIKSSDTVDPLIDMLQDDDWFTRISAAAALEQIRDERGRQAIKGLLKDSDMVVQMRAERILTSWKKEAAKA